MEVDLFGNEIVKDELLRDKFIEPPFSILDTKSGNWQKRKRLWIGKGLKSEVGRDAKVINMDTVAKEKNSAEYVSFLTLHFAKFYIIGFVKMEEIF